MIRTFIVKKIDIFCMENRSFTIFDVFTFSALLARYIHLIVWIDDFGQLVLCFPNRAEIEGDCRAILYGG